MINICKIEALRISEIRVMETNAHIHSTMHIRRGSTGKQWNVSANMTESKIRGTLTIKTIPKWIPIMLTAVTEVVLEGTEHLSSIHLARKASMATRSMIMPSCTIWIWRPRSRWKSVIWNMYLLKWIYWIALIVISSSRASQLANRQM